MGVNISGFSGLYESAPSNIAQPTPISDFNRLLNCSFLDAPFDLSNSHEQNSAISHDSANAIFFASQILQRTLPISEFQNDSQPVVSLLSSSLNFDNEEEHEMIAWNSISEKGFLSPEDVKSLPVMHYNSKMKTHHCVICLSNYEDTSKLKILPCFHYFHKDCIVTWLENSNHCPICQCAI